MKRSISITFAIASALIGPFTTFAQSSKQPTPVPVFVTSVGAVNGFTDPNRDNQDTMKDLRDSLKGFKKEITIVDQREQAVIVLIVQSRQKAQATAGALGAGRDCIVRIKFVFRDSETEMSGSALGGLMSSGGAWSKAAGKVAKQVRDWVRENASKLATE